MAGAVGFVGALGVHATTGYLDFLHLVPAGVALALYVAGLSASFAYLWALPVRPVGAPARAAELAR